MKNKFLKMLFHKSNERPPEAAGTAVNSPDLFAETKELLRELDKGTVEVSKTISATDDPQAAIRTEIPQAGIEVSIGHNKQVLETTIIRVTIEKRREIIEKKEAATGHLF